jgi:hypothetical protein
MLLASPAALHADDTPARQRPGFTFAQQPGVLTSEFIFETAPHPQCHAGTIVETEGGLVAA